jgi:hypothetical protein
MRERRFRPAARFTGVSDAVSVTSSGDSDLDFLKASQGQCQQHEKEEFKKFFSTTAENLHNHKD